MRILALSDEEAKALWDYYTPGKLDGIDLIISCGDLKSSYLTFLSDMSHCPVLYVHGNHDEKYRSDPPGGCDCIDGKLVKYNGVRILGLPGCRWYHPGIYQVTEKQMRIRLKKLWFPLRRARGVDVVVTHAPPYGCGDGQDPAHIGFSALLPFLERYKPALLLHGHVHMTYGMGLEREHIYDKTRVLNCYERMVVEIPDGPHSARDHNRLIWMNGEPDYPEE